MKSSKTFDAFDSNRNFNLNLSFNSNAVQSGYSRTASLDSPRSLSENRRPFFYLPVDEDDTDSNATFADDHSLIFNNNEELLNDPDLCPVPKTGLIYSTQSSPTALQSPDSVETDVVTEGLTLQKRANKSRAHRDRRYKFEDPEIKRQIQQCLARARYRSTSLSGAGGSIEAGLYRLEELLEEKDTQSTSSSGGGSYGFRSLDNVPLPRLMPKQLKNASTLTDVCVGENVAEVEIISLVEEQIPQYKLRADTYSEFAGYEGWSVSFPALKEEEVEALSPEQAEGALAYFVLCGNRVSQMTKTYSDIEAVTRLLEEKEKDLELAAKIGQQLLQRNKALEERNGVLEQELTTSSDKITQLRHDLQMKTDLLQIYTNDIDESSCETTPSSYRNINVDILQRRVKSLEDDNQELRQEAKKLACDTEVCEDREKELVTDVIKQLNDANLQVVQMEHELSKKVEDSLRQQEEITQFLAQIVDLQARNKRLTIDNEELTNMVGVARECQSELTTELADLKEKYAEVLDLLHDTQNQLRRVQKKNIPGSRGTYLGGLYSSPFNSGHDSIASELNSLGSSDGEFSNRENSKNLNRVFDTVKMGSKLGVGPAQGAAFNLGYGNSPYSTPTRQGNCVMSSQMHMTDSRGYGPGSGGYNPGGYSSYYGSQGSSVYTGSSGHPSLDSGADSDASMHTDSEDNYPASKAGVPGWPGTPDLNSCLRRIGGPVDKVNAQSAFLPYGCRTPDSIMSTGSLKSSMSSSGYGSSAGWSLPQKLQIVKPIEGSQTLHQWSMLATPHLGGLLEEREGVAIKGGAGSDLNLEVYSMSDLEEDDEPKEDEDNPGKRFMYTAGVNTYTNSTVLHPDEQTVLTPSVMSSKVSNVPVTSIPNTFASMPGTPSKVPSCPSSRRGSTATFSTNVGLAKLLHERGVAGDNKILPTATPANSPDGSRPGSPEPYTYKLPGLEDLTKTFSYGASLIRRTIYGREKMASEASTPVATPRINLVERVQAMGVDRFVGTHGNIMAVGGVVTTRPETPSPLLQLSSLIISNAKANNEKDTPTTANASTTSNTAAISGGGIMAAPKISSPGTRKPRLPPGAPLGVPGIPGSGSLDNRLNQLKPGQRADLGTVGAVGARARPTSLGTVPGRGPKPNDQKIGTVGWTSLGRKGGLM